METILDKKGSEITLLDLREQAVFADYFLICNGENDRQLQAMANGIAQDAKQKAQALAKSVEGSPESGWVWRFTGASIFTRYAPFLRFRRLMGQCPRCNANAVNGFFAQQNSAKKRLTLLSKARRF